MARPAQQDVWAAVDERFRCHDVRSPSDALTDIYRTRRDTLRELQNKLAPVENQLGALVQIHGRPVAFDFVSRPRVFAELLPRLADGYALQALEAGRSTPTGATGPSLAAARDFLTRALRSQGAWLTTPGRGDAYRLTHPTRVLLAAH